MAEYPYNNDLGQTDLMGAAYHGDADEVSRILSMPCDIDAQDSHAMTALMYAAMKGHTDVVRQVADHRGNLELQSGQRYTALMYAVRGGHTATAHALLSAGADPDVHGQDDVFDTPLTIAARRGFLPIVRALVAAGADVGLRGAFGSFRRKPSRGVRGITISRNFCSITRRGRPFKAAVALRPCRSDSWSSLDQ